MEKIKIYVICVEYVAIYSRVLSHNFITYSHGSGESAERITTEVYMKWQNLNPATQNLLTDCHQNLYKWSCLGYLPSCKILCTSSDKAFHFCACANVHTWLFTWLFFPMLLITHTQDARIYFDAKYIKRRGSTQECASSGQKTKINI